MQLLFYFIFLLFSSSSTKTDSSINFSGDWAINKAKVDFGQAPDWILPKIFSITQNDSSINIKTTLLDPQGSEHIYTDSLFFDSRANSIAMYTGSTRVSSLKWDESGKSFNVSIRSAMPDGQGSSIKENWSLGDGGKTLVINRDVTQTNGLHYTIKGYYDKK